VACGAVPDDGFQEGHQRASGSPHTAYKLQIYLVHDAPHRYLAKFDFRHNSRVALGVNDTERTDELAKSIVGKRLTYRRPNRANV
jgi:hypothetical protein